MPPAAPNPAPLAPYDAVLVVSFGGPEGPEDVLPFLRTVTRGRGIPDERLAAVAEHYHHFAGVSPINAQNRALVAALEAELAASGPALPVHFGNRNWHPFLADTLRAMATAGVRRAVAFVTSAYSSYSGCRQYREDIARAQAEGGDGAPQVEVLRRFYNHPGFLEPVTELTRAALAQVPAERRAAARLAFTAHSIPVTMARTSGPDGNGYPTQLADTARVVVTGLDAPYDWSVVYQSRSGPPPQPWLEPDVGDFLDAVAAAGARDVVLVPIGFVSDHLEVCYDLDVEAARRARELGLNLVRAATVGTHPRFVAMVGALIRERLTPGAPRPALGRLGPHPDQCPLDCCPAPRRPARPASLDAARTS